MSLALLLPLIAQIGPGGALPQAPLDIRRKGSTVVAPASPPVPLLPRRFAGCLDAVQSSPEDGLSAAEAWLAGAKGEGRAEAEQCRGVALAALQRWGEAEAAFVAGRDAAGPADHALRARLGAMAGNAALAGKAPDRALALLDSARGDAGDGGDANLSGGIAVDRARALVALSRVEEAESALAEARASTPQNAVAWLLSATLSRRQGRLGVAQAQIEEAVRLAPTDPEAGLEAGVIAMLGGREAAARKSWESVIAIAPGSVAARTARGYLDQLAPPPQSPGR